VNALTTRARAALWWLAPLAVLAILIGWEAGWGSGIRKKPPPEVTPPAKPVVMALMPEYSIAGGVGAHTETVTRTLFNPTRRQAAVIADASKARMQRGQFALTGTTVIDGRSTAFLRETAGGKSRRVHQGEIINGVTVAEVKPDRVKLALGDETEELVLRVATNPRPTAQAAAPVPPPAGSPPQPPAPGATPQPAQAAQPAAAGDAAQSLAARRAAARAAANAAQPGQPAGVAPPIAPTPTPATAAQPAAAPAASPDPAWLNMYRRYQQPVQPLVPK
jgi:hypothetical protein